MTITFYKTVSEKNRVDKTLTDSKIITGTLKEKTSIISPSLIVKVSNNFNIFDYNYCYIQDFNRYYFINEITNINANLFDIDLTIDVLMTYKISILNLECKIEKYSGSNPNNKLNTSDDYTTTKIEYTYPFTNLDNSSMVLVALNGDSIQ